MVHQLIRPHHCSACSDHDHDGSLNKPARHPDAVCQAIRTRTVGQVTVLEVADPLNDVGEELDEAIQLALADGPRGVVCDLSVAPGDADRDAVKWLAIAGRHVRHWAGTPVAVACPNPRVRQALSAQPVGRHLIVSASMPSAVSAALATPISAIEWMQPAPHRCPHFSGLRGPYPAELGIGSSDSLCCSGDQRARDQLDRVCRLGDRVVRGLGPEGRSTDRSRQESRPATPAEGPSWLPWARAHHRGWFFSRLWGHAHRRRRQAGLGHP